MQGPREVEAWFCFRCGEARRRFSDIGRGALSHVGVEQERLQACVRGCAVAQCVDCIDRMDVFEARMGGLTGLSG
jgi:hypothetical protein